MDKIQNLGRASAAHGVMANKQGKSSQKLWTQKKFQNENPKNALSVFAEFLSIAPAAHGVLANHSGKTMRIKIRRIFPLNKNESFKRICE